MRKFNIHKRYGVILLSLVVFSALLAAPGCASGSASSPDSASGRPSDTTDGGPEDTTKIRLAVQSSDIQPFIAEAKGFFEAEGLEVELITFSYGPPIVEAMTAGEVDFGFLGDLPAFTGIANGADITIVGTNSTAETFHGIIVRDDSGIHSLSDLAGKRVSVPFGSNVQPLLHLFFNEGGVDESEVEIINLAVTDGVTSIVNGDIDAAVVWEPNITIATQEGNGVSLLRTGEGLKLFVNPIIARGEFTAAHPELTAKLLRALHQSGQWAKEHMEEAAAIISGYNDIDYDAIYVVVDNKGLSLKLEDREEEALRAGVEQALAYDLLTVELDISQHIDTSYLVLAGIQEE